LPADLLRPTRFGAIVARHPLLCLDVGSRGGFEPDLLPIAFAVDAVGFEPEAEAFALLAAAGPSPWRSLSHLPVALAGGDGERILYIPRDPQSASLLEHDASIGVAFGKTQFFERDRTLAVATRTLDGVLAEHGLADQGRGGAAYLKLDVEGAEREVLDAAPGTLGDLLAIKLEVSFLRFRHGQPLAAELDLFLREAGFMVMDFIRPAHWRMHGYTIHPQAGAGPIPYSRGQLMQGDFLCFRRPETVDAPERLFQLAALHMAHGFFDHAAAILATPSLRAWLAEAYGADPEALVAEASRRFGLAVWRRSVADHLRRLWTYGRSLGHLLRV
jgi:FkbM family methyltransferase